MSGEQQQPGVDWDKIQTDVTGFVNIMKRGAATSNVLRAVRAERARQDERWGEQNHPDRHGGVEARVEAIRVARIASEVAKIHNAEHVERGTLDWTGILLEEVYEALAESDPALLRAELVQVAAVAVCWIENIDRREAAKKREDES